MTLPDSVHAMRVACRRMRSTLQSFRALLDRERTDAVVAELRWLAGELGGARDLEVQEERIGRAVGDPAARDRARAGRRAGARFFGRRRAEASATAAGAPWMATGTSCCSTPSTRCLPPHP